MKIQVVGGGCSKCDQLYQHTKEALDRLQRTDTVEKVESLKDIVALGVMTSPSLMVDGKLIVSGRVASVKEIVKLLS